MAGQESLHIDCDGESRSPSPSLPVLEQHLAAATPVGGEITSKEPLVPDFRLSAEGGASMPCDDSCATSSPLPPAYIQDLKPDHFHTSSNADSSDHSLTTPDTTQASNSSMEIFLGPQPLPFIRNRPRLVTESFDAYPQRRVSDPSLSAASLAPLQPSSSRSVSDSSLVAASLAHLKPFHSLLPRPPVSNWRREQLKNIRTVRPVQGARERPIPLLHGPLSLPYARNPSGVDATVADQSSYFSNVFGLRMAPSSDAGHRTVSNSSGDLRVVSNSSGGLRIVSNSTTGGRAFSSSSYDTTISVTSSRPSVVRDHHQLIGIKNNTSHNSMAPLGGLGIGKPVTTTAVPSLPQDDAIHSASGVLWRVPSEPPKTEFKILTLVDPTSNNVYHVRVPKADPECAVPVEVISKRGSKADTSVNWRSKVEKIDKVDYKWSPLSRPTAPAPPSNTPVHALTADHDIMFDNLCRQLGDLKFVEPIVHLPTSTRPRPIPAPVICTLSETTNRRVNVVTPIAEEKKKSIRKESSSRSKGTPGAGKHLKQRPAVDKVAPENQIGVLASVSSASPAPASRKQRSKAGSPGRRKSKTIKA